MPYLSSPPFQHDVFVSYAHGPPTDAPARLLTGWTRALAQAVEDEIRALKAEFREFEVFIDPDLDPTRPLTPELRDKVQGSGLLLVVMTEHYLESSWCRDEIDWFEAQVRRREREGGLYFVVRMQPTPRDRWPKALLDERGSRLPGFLFHAEKREPGGLVRPFGWPTPDVAKDRDFYEAVATLTDWVVRRLGEIKRDQAVAEAVASRADGPGPGEPSCVYLQAPRTDATNWQHVREQLLASGCCVVPDTLSDFSGGLAAVKRAYEERLQLIRERAHAMCLLCSPDGTGFEKLLLGLINDRAMLRERGRELPCAILNIGPASEAVIAARAHGIDVLEGAPEDPAQAMQSWLLRVLAPGA